MCRLRIRPKRGGNPAGCRRPRPQPRHRQRPAHILGRAAGHHGRPGPARLTPMPRMMFVWRWDIAWPETLLNAPLASSPASAARSASACPRPGHPLTGLPRSRPQYPAVRDSRYPRRARPPSGSQPTRTRRTPRPGARITSAARYVTIGSFKHIRYVTGSWPAEMPKTGARPGGTAGPGASPPSQPTAPGCAPSSPPLAANWPTPTPRPNA
jgi:hypothetical protein